VDAAHGFGLPNLGHRGIAEVVSFSFTKLITGMEGGMILTDDDTLAIVARELRRLSGRMGEINALLVMECIKWYNEVGNAERTGYVGQYSDIFDFAHELQRVPEACNHSVFAVEFERTSIRNSVMMALYQAGYETKNYYEPLITGLTNTDEVYNHTLCLPTHRQIDIANVAQTINRAVHDSPTPGRLYMERAGYLD